MFGAVNTFYYCFTKIFLYQRRHSADFLPGSLYPEPAWPAPPRGAGLRNNNRVSGVL
jgi:hypothetical protein